MALATLVAYLPVLGHGFVDFDDQSALVENPFFRGLGPTQLRWMLTNLDYHYVPLTWLSFAIDHALWGMNATGYHLTNLLLHVANAVAFYWLSVRLLRAAFELNAGTEPPGLFAAAGFSAALFALHPLRVESVAWVTERRDVLSGLFALLAFGSYLGTHAARRQPGRPPVAWVALGLYTLSLLAKPVGMTLPVVFVVLDVYPLRRLPGAPGRWLDREHRAVWIEKAPFALLGLVTAVVEGISEAHVDAFYSLAQYAIAGRIGQVFFALAFYLRKTLVPIGLSPLYPIPVGWQFLRLDVFVAATVVIGITAVAVRIRARHPWGLAAWVCYAVLLAPVLGIAQAGPHIAADRYSYLATLSLAAVAGGAAFTAAERVGPGRARGLWAAAVAVALALGALTWRQTAVWGDSITLWQTALAADPACYICADNLGNAFVRAGRESEARPYFEAALRIQPGDADAYANLAAVALREGRDAEARQQLAAALRLDPDHAGARTNLGRMLVDAGDPEAAIPHLEIALRKDPLMGEAQTNLGLALMARGDLDGAERALRVALRVLPDQALVHNNFGILLLKRERYGDATAEFRQAIALDPAFPEPRFNLGLALSADGRDDEAMATLREALRLRPSYASAHQKLAQLLRERGDDDEALAHVVESARHAASVDDATGLALAAMDAGRSREAIAILRALLERDPRSREAANMLAWLLATSPEAELRDGSAAVALAESATATPEPDADQIDTLAAAYAEAGRFRDAVAAAGRAEGLARAAGDAEFAAEIAARRASYERHRPYRRD